MAQFVEQYSCVGICALCGTKIDGIGQFHYKYDQSGKKYHENCPKCSKCGNVLSGECYDTSLGKLCIKCGKQSNKKMDKPSYSTLKSNMGNGCSCGNGQWWQCAIKMSQALIKCDSGWKQIFKNSGKNICACGYIRGAQDMAAVIKSQWGTRDYGSKNSILGKKGIITYMNIKNFSGQGHVDIYPDGTEFWDCETVWFWEL